MLCIIIIISSFPECLCNVVRLLKDDQGLEHIKIHSSFVQALYQGTFRHVVKQRYKRPVCIDTGRARKWGRVDSQCSAHGKRYLCGLIQHHLAWASEQARQHGETEGHRQVG